MAAEMQSSINVTQSALVATKGAAARVSSGERGDKQVIRDRYNFDASAMWSEDGDALQFGPIPAGMELTRVELTSATSATDPTYLATGDLGTVTVGWAYADGTGTADPDAFTPSALDLSADQSLLGKVIAAGRCAPPTNDRAWYLTITSVAVLGAADCFIEVAMEGINPGRKANPSV